MSKRPRDISRRSAGTVLVDGEGESRLSWGGGGEVNPKRAWRVAPLALSALSWLPFLLYLLLILPLACLA